MEKIKKTNFLGLPEEVKFCKKCEMTNQRPSSVIEFKNNHSSNFSNNEIITTFLLKTPMTSSNDTDILEIF